MRAAKRMKMRNRWTQRVRGKNYHYSFVPLIHLNMFYLLSLRSRVGVRSVCLYSLGQSGPSAWHTQPEATVLQDTLSRGALCTQWWSKLWDIVSTWNLTMILNLNLKQDFWSKIISLSQMTCFKSKKIPVWFNGLEVFDATVQSNWS